MTQTCPLLTISHWLGRLEGASINSIKAMGARQNGAKKRSIHRYVSILSHILMPQTRLQWIYRSALELIRREVNAYPFQLSHQSNCFVVSQARCGFHESKLSSLLV
jgi:hypothetical protein